MQQDDAEIPLGCKQRLLMTPENAQRCFDGTKTQTRRMNGLEYINQAPDVWFIESQDGALVRFRTNAGILQMGLCPYGRKGDRLIILRGRIIVELLDIRVERVQAITEEDAIAEGCLPQVDAEIAASVAGDTPARMEFWALWTSIYAVEGWNQNPWVWVITFRKLEA